MPTIKIMLNDLVTILVNLLTNALSGVTVSGSRVDLSALSGPTVTINLAKHQSYYLDLARNQRAITFEVCYFNSATDLSAWETNCRSTVWTILNTLEGATTLGSGVSWAAQSSTSEASLEYSSDNPIPVYKLELTFLINQNVRS
ncbi:MAG: hypothetical protein Q4G02_00435 [bacterium]|nr:hypothetical protein [bacterium]